MIDIGGFVELKSKQGHTGVVVNNYVHSQKVFWLDDYNLSVHQYSDLVEVPKPTNTKEFIYKILHKPTGLFYCPRKGRIRDDKTNLSKKGSFYTSLKVAERVYNEDCERSNINKAQVEKYNLIVNQKDRWSYSKAKKEEFVIKTYALQEIN